METAMTDDHRQTVEALVQRAREGDSVAFQGLMNLYGERLLRQIRARMGQRVGSVMEAEDVSQETFSRALGAIAKFRWQGEESFYRWLAGIAEHLIRSASQKKCIDKLQLTRDVPADATTASTSVRRDERFDRLERAINRLSPDQRTALKLARIDGMPVRKIAAEMQRSEKAIYALLSRALDRLRETFGDTESLQLPDRVFKVNEGGDDS
jgi:RNA polymerase sigma-70 factor, ECF subfamily